MKCCCTPSTHERVLGRQPKYYSPIPGRPGELCQTLCHRFFFQLKRDNTEVIIPIPTSDKKNRIRKRKKQFNDLMNHHESVCLLPSEASANTSMHAFITSRLDFCVAVPPLSSRGHKKIATTKLSWKRGDNDAHASHQF